METNAQGSYKSFLTETDLNLFKIFIGLQGSIYLTSGKKFIARIIDVGDEYIFLESRVCRTLHRLVDIESINVFNRGDRNGQ